MQLSRRQWFRHTSALGLASYWVSQGFSQEAAKGQARLIARQEQPYNAEPALPDLVKNHLTPIDLFFVRSHGDVPKVEEASFKVKISGLVNRELEFSVAELRDKFKPHNVAATLTCAGNRRQEMSAIKSIPGVQWDAGAIGHAEWIGPMLTDILKAAELKPDAKHVWLEGLDPIKEKNGSVAPFGGSIPLEKALATEGRNLPSVLAHSMNGKPLTPAHGAPLRLVVPGYIGARSVKWLAKIVVSDRTSPNHYLADTYKVIQTDDPAETKKAEPIYEFPINVAIGLAEGTKLTAGKQTIRGFALAEGKAESHLTAVELSTNGGRTWIDVPLRGRSAPFSWTLWEATVDIAPGPQTLVARAASNRAKTPEKGEWNLKGYLYNGWHRVRVEGVS